MKLAGLAILALLAAPVMAGDVPAWEGYWSPNAAWCARAGTPGEETPDWYGRDGLFGLEWSCEVESATPTGVGQSWAMQLNCLDAGYAFEQAQVFMLTPHDRLLIIDEAGSVENMVRCKGDDQ